MEDLEKGDDYDYIILQATDNAISFYERMGFVRVGAIARPDQNFLNRKGKVSTGEKASGVGSKNKEDAVTIKREKVKYRREKLCASYDWRPFCVKILKNLLALPEAKVLKDSRPSMFKFEQQRCLDLSSLLDALRDKDAEEQRKMIQEHNAFDPTSWMRPTVVSNFTNAEDVSFEVQLILQSVQKDSNLNNEVKSAAQKLLDAFYQAWNMFGDDLVANGTQVERHTPRKNGFNHTPTKSARLKEISTKEEKLSKMDKENQFYVYVDIEWRDQRGFRLYEIVGKVNASGEMCPVLLFASSAALAFSAAAPYSPADLNPLPSQQASSQVPRSCSTCGNGTRRRSSSRRRERIGISFPSSPKLRSRSGCSGLNGAVWMGYCRRLQFLWRSGAAAGRLMGSRWITSRSKSSA
eukprot:750467-Hanusia_phi.AAC.3